MRLQCGFARFVILLHLATFSAISSRRRTNVAQKNSDNRFVIAADFLLPYKFTLLSNSQLYILARIALVLLLHSVLDVPVNAFAF